MLRSSPRRFEPSELALVIVDVQNDFCHPEGRCGKRGSNLSSIIPMVPRLDSFIDQCREEGVKIIFVRTANDDHSESWAWRSRFFDLDPQEPSPTPICQAGSWGAEFYGVSPDPADAVIVKHRYSAFSETNIDLVLRTAGIKSILVAGVATNVCIDSTLRDGLAHDYHVTLVEDCSAAFEEELHDATVSTISRYFGAVARSTDIVSTWESEAEIDAPLRQFKLST